MERVINHIASKKKEIIITKNLSRDEIVIVDFFNIYCNIVKFNRYKTFSKESFITCMDIILKRFVNHKVLIVSKNIFEVEREYIDKITVENPNVTYIIVHDSYFLKSLNRERDDYACLLLQKYILKMNRQKSCIITNDKYKNYTGLISTIKPFKLDVINKGVFTTFDFCQKLISKYSLKMKEPEFLYASSFSLV